MSDDDQIDNLISELQDLKSEVEDNQDDIDNVEDKINVIEARLDGIKNIVDKNKAKVDEVKSLENRIEVLEERNIGNKSVNHLALKDMSELKVLEELPREFIEDELKKPTSRALDLWKNFDNWSEPAISGMIVSSSKAKEKLESNRDEELSFSQVHRCMKKLEKFSPDNYTLEEQEEGRKVIIKTS